ncbi:CSN8/PSMD8/EIF3K family protein [Aspergillus lucknowensis]|uniref:COP9 signalosome n=1 Tax=Aspergillus lucknowensis TaxID=176173 RepID=A0ABR4LZJ9_9EURO
MDAPPLSQDRLSAVLAAAPSPADLYTSLSDYEEQACLIPTTHSKEVELLSAFYTAFFFSHLLTDQIEEARALTKRIPQTILQTDSIQNCLVLLRAVWQRKYTEIYKILRELPWPERSRSVVQSYESYFQQKTLKEVSNSYEAIRPAAAATYLGLDPTLAEQGDQGTIQKFVACGWKWDEKTRLLHPKPLITAPPKDESLQNEFGRIMALISHQGS